jgi:hypothetical protein
MTGMSQTQWLEDRQKKIREREKRMMVSKVDELDYLRVLEQHYAPKSPMLCVPKPCK